MSTPKEGGRIPPQEGSVHWVIPPESLEGLPTPSLWKERALVSEVGGHEVAVGVFALPSRESRISKFWSAVTGKRGETPDIVRLKIEPSVPLTDYKKGDHTRLSALYPYAVMEDETRYGLGLWVPGNMFGEWSDPQVREGGGGKLFGDKEMYRQRKVPAILVRLDGKTPLAEEKSITGRRTEHLIGLPDPKNPGEDSQVVIAQRQVSEGGKKATVSDLTFNVIGERGEASNTIIDNSGLVQVVVAQVTEEEIIERIFGPSMVGLPSSDFGDLTRSPMKSPDIFRSTLDTGVDSTLRGETRFTRKRKEKVSIKGVTNVNPVAVFNFSLVGNGGPISAEMTEAVMGE